MGHNFFSVFSTTNAVDGVARITQKLEAGQPWNGYLQARNANGQLVVLQTTLMRLNTPPEVEGPLFILPAIRSRPPGFASS